MKIHENNIFWADNCYDSIVGESYFCYILKKNTIIWGKYVDFLSHLSSAFDKVSMNEDYFINLEDKVSFLKGGLISFLVQVKKNLDGKTQTEFYEFYIDEGVAHIGYTGNNSKGYNSSIFRDNNLLESFRELAFSIDKERISRFDVYKVKDGWFYERLAKGYHYIDTVDQFGLSYLTCRNGLVTSSSKLPEYYTPGANLKLSSTLKEFLEWLYDSRFGCDENYPEKLEELLNLCSKYIKELEGFSTDKATSILALVYLYHYSDLLTLGCNYGEIFSLARDLRLFTRYLVSFELELVFNCLELSGVSLDTLVRGRSLVILDEIEIKFDVSLCI